MAWTDPRATRWYPAAPRPRGSAVPTSAIRPP
jgi:hypothetical protein